MKEFHIRPGPGDPRLSMVVRGIDQDGQAVDTSADPKHMDDEDRKHACKGSHAEVSD